MTDVDTIMATQQLSTPPISRSSSQTSKGRHSPTLSLDLTDLPALIQPSPPSNTLLITNLDDPTIFTPDNLSIIRTALQRHSPEPIHAFSPLRSLRRIILVLPTTESALTVRTYLDTLPGSLYSLISTSDSTHSSNTQTHTRTGIRIYFAAPTPVAPLAESDRHLLPPKASKQFFISPPPSPPVGWESREEGAPNTEVHAPDLASALASLHKQTRRLSLDVVAARAAAAEGRGSVDMVESPAQLEDAESRDTLQEMQSPTMSSPTTKTGSASASASAARSRSGTLKGRKRSSSIVVFQPPEEGGMETGSPRLPAVVVEDMTMGDEGEEEGQGLGLGLGIETGRDEEMEEVREELQGRGARQTLFKTARPPTELMMDL